MLTARIRTAANIILLLILLSIIVVPRLRGTHLINKLTVAEWLNSNLTNVQVHEKDDNDSHEEYRENTDNIQANHHHQHHPKQQQGPKNQAHNDCHPEIIETGDWTPPRVPRSLRKVQQNDKKLTEHICEEWLLPPFTSHRHLIHPHARHYSQYNQSFFIDEMLGHKRNGFYIESGAACGESFSNSLFFEKSRNWTGLLVEANPKFFKSLLTRRRHAYMVNACLSPTTQPMSLSFKMADYSGGLTNFMEDKHKERIEEYHPESEIVKVQCFPLFSILQAMGISHVDYFSLDIEGAELEVLRTLPLDKISVDVFSIEYKISYDKKASDAKFAEIEAYLVKKHGYEVMRPGYTGGDVILMKGTLLS